VLANYGHSHTDLLGFFLLIFVSEFALKIKSCGLNWGILQIAPGILIWTLKSYAVISLRWDAMMGSIATRTANFKCFIFILLLFFML
jgi:hypothetical protein